MNVKSYAVHAAAGELAPLEITRRALRPDDVRIKILYCGVCHTDLHFARNDWGNTHYPLVPGHEIVGIVEQIGAEVTQFNVGDIVGVGCMVDSCRHCDACRGGAEQYCSVHHVMTYNDVDDRDGMRTYGGYSQRIIVSEPFVLRVPPTLELPGVAPLLCAGATTWSALRGWNAGRGCRVGVLGLGGLGHVALKLAKALGAVVTVFTASREKMTDAKKMGADEVIYSDEKSTFSLPKKPLDLILDTIPVNHDINPYVAALAAGGTHVMIGYLGKLEPPIDTTPLVRARKNVTGSLIAGIAETQEMLDFCGEHGITSEVEIIDINDINNAYERMQCGDVRYRFVIDLKTLE